MLRSTSTAAALLAALALIACGRGSKAGAPTPGAGGERAIQVAVTLPVFADFVRQIGGESAEVFALLPPGADPHTYEPTPSDIRRIGEADVIFVNALESGLEGSILGLIQSNKGDETDVIPFSAAAGNPHPWLDPVMARAYADVIAEALTARHPGGAALYRENLAEYSRQLESLDLDIAAAVKEVPPENRELITVHDAFPHFARRYGLELLGVVVSGPGQDPSPREMAELTDMIKARSVSAVFSEPQIGPESRILQQIAADAGVRVCTLYSDTLDENVPTYVDMMRFNADELVRCLGGGDD